MNIRTKLIASVTGSVLLLSTLAGVSTASAPIPVCDEPRDGASEVVDAMADFREFEEERAFSPADKLVVADGYGSITAAHPQRLGWRSEYEDARQDLHAAELEWALYLECQEDAHRLLLRDTFESLEDVHDKADDLAASVSFTRDTVNARATALDASVLATFDAVHARANALSTQLENARAALTSYVDVRATALDAAVAEARATLLTTIDERATALDLAVQNTTNTVNDRASILDAAVAEARATLLTTIDERATALDLAVQNTTDTVNDRASILDAAVAEARATLLTTIDERATALDLAVQAATDTVNARATILDAAVAEARATLLTTIDERATALDLAVQQATDTVNARADALDAAVQAATDTVNARADTLDAAVAAGLADTLATITTRADALDDAVAASTATINARATTIDAAIETVRTQMHTRADGLQAQNADAIARLGALAQQLSDVNAANLAEHEATQAQADALEAHLSGVEVKVDRIVAQNEAELDRDVEEAIDTCNKRVTYFTREANGGQLDRAFVVAQTAITQYAAAVGTDSYHGKAVTEFNKAKTARDSGDNRGAFYQLCKSYNEISG